MSHVNALPVSDGHIIFLSSMIFSILHQHYSLQPAACISTRHRGVYSGKSDCLVLLKNKSFYRKPAKNVYVLNRKLAKKLMKEQR